MKNIGWMQRFTKTAYTKVIRDIPLSRESYRIGRQVSAGEVILGPPRGTGDGSMYFAFFGKQENR